MLHDEEYSSFMPEIVQEPSSAYALYMARLAIAYWNMFGKLQCFFLKLEVYLV